MCPQQINGVQDSIFETRGNFGKVLVNEVIAKLANNVVARRLPVENVHERVLDLCWASKPSVRWLTEAQDSASANSLDARPSESSVSSSSGVPANPGRVRCSTAAKAASTTSSTDW